MTKNEYYTIKGYIAILEAASPNGRYVHKIRNKISGLRLSLDMQTSLPNGYEYEVRKLIDSIFTLKEVTINDCM